jgi:hypothetical protein
MHAPLFASPAARNERRAVSGELNGAIQHRPGTGAVRLSINSSVACHEALKIDPDTLRVRDDRLPPRHATRAG